MSETKFTPGPWFADFVDYAAVIDADDNIVCVCEPENCKANTHLIAAAPDMYKTLEWLLHIHSIPGIARGEIQKALAKARGEA